MEEKIRMISAAAQALLVFRHDPNAIDEEVFQYVSNYIESENIKDEEIKRGMIAAAAKAIQIARKNPKMSEKEVLREVMNEIPNLLAVLHQEESQ